MSLCVYTQPQMLSENSKNLCSSVTEKCAIIILKILLLVWYYSKYCSLTVKYDVEFYRQKWRKIHFTGLVLLTWCKTAKLPMKYQIQHIFLSWMNYRGIAVKQTFTIQSAVFCCHMQNTHAFAVFLNLIANLAVKYSMSVYTVIKSFNSMMYCFYYSYKPKY